MRADIEAWKQAAMEGTRLFHFHLLDRMRSPVFACDRSENRLAEATN